MILLRSLRPTELPSTLFRIPHHHHRTMSYSTLQNYLVTPKELHEALRTNSPSSISTDPRVIPLCGAWFLPNDPQRRTGHAVFRASRIPSARFFDLDAVKDPRSPYPHMLPSPQDFAAAMRKLGIRRDDTVVVYDSKELGIFSAPRVAWTLKVFGHEGVHVLDNFKLWVEQGYPVEEGEPAEVREVEYPVPEMEKERVVVFEEMKERVLEQGKEGAEEVIVLDARSRGRWEGTEPEPREGLSSGHMPHSINIPISEVLDPQTKGFLPSSELKTFFEKKGVDPSKPIISSCGTGVTAAVLDAALARAGYPDAGRRIYDGSWTEWAQRVNKSDSLIRKVGQP